MATKDAYRLIDEIHACMTNGLRMHHMMAGRFIEMQTLAERCLIHSQPRKKTLKMGSYTETFKTSTCQQEGPQQQLQVLLALALVPWRCKEGSQFCRPMLEYWWLPRSRQDQNHQWVRFVYSQVNRDRQRRCRVQGPHSNCIFEIKQYIRAMQVH